MEDKLYWLWFTLKKGITPKESSELLKEYKTAKEIYNTKDYGKGVKDSLSEILNDKSLYAAELVYKKTENMGGYIVTIEDEEYPPLLKNLHYPPYVLYMRGERLNWKELLTVTVVGTRSCSKYGKIATEAITSSLAERGVVIVSGMARGIDAVAGTTALKCGGKTVAVLGSGLDVIYPSEHRELYDEICKNGVVMTEYPPGTRPLRENFPRRNRIMAGLSYGVIVGQAPEKSGVLITVSYAVENGRDVFVIPADIFEEGFEGSHNLLRQGAKLVTCADDIINEYPYIELNPIDNIKPYVRDKLSDIDMNMLNAEEREIVLLLGEEDMHIDDIARILGKASSEINSLMVLLEINGIVKKENGNIYHL